MGTDFALIIMVAFNNAGLSTFSASTTENSSLFDYHTFNLCSPKCNGIKKIIKN